MNPKVLIIVPTRSNETHESKLRSLHVDENVGRRHIVLKASRSSSVGVSIQGNQVHPRRLMGKTKYAIVSDTVGQRSEARQQSAEAMPAVPKAGFSQRLAMIKRSIGK